VSEPKRINCRVHNVDDGSKHLVFEVAGTGECVGEVRVVASDAGYLPVISHLFAQWVSGAQRFGPRALSLAVKRGINGSH
jgi:hypothetical protein